jgi:hypothetical protein
MNSQSRIGAAMLALVISLSVSPLLNAAPERSRGHDRAFRERERDPIVRVVKKIRDIVRKFTGQDEYPVPPIP